MITIKNLTKIYGGDGTEVVAVNDISIEIPSGKFVAIVGESGSGKSTLLNLIGALDTATSGSIDIDGDRLEEMDKNQLAEFRNKKLGFVFQSYNLDLDFTVLENVEMPLLIAGVDKTTRREKAREMINKLNIGEKTDVFAKKLSGGQRQRVSIARALVGEPDYILADEPTGNLDSQNGAEVISILRQIADQGKTVILVTHNKNDAKAVDLVLEMKDGEIVNVVDKEQEDNAQ
ncbi:MAG: ABC transporter ATP-binding protein [Eubacteriales bacterium]|nr:ABC transporter ATP-binding protein [Eubacteriales bacterium]